MGQGENHRPYRIRQKQSHVYLSVELAVVLIVEVPGRKLNGICGVMLMKVSSRSTNMRGVGLQLLLAFKNDIRQAA